MAKLNFNLFGYSFQHSLNILTNSFRVAGAVLEDGVSEARAAAEAHRAGIAQGADWIGERDNDGVVIWDHADHLDYEADLAEEAAMELRKAYVIAAYHHWERSSRGWAGENDRHRHIQLVSATRAAGYPVHPKLDAIQHLVNTLKHENDTWGSRLMKSWPEVLPANFEPLPDGRTSWFEAIQLSNDQVLEAFATIAASGPTKDDC